MSKLGLGIQELHFGVMDVQKMDYQAFVRIFVFTLNRLQRYNHWKCYRRNLCNVDNFDWTMCFKDERC